MARRPILTWPSGGIAAVTMMLLKVAPGHAAGIQWAVFFVGAAAVASLVLNYRRSAPLIPATLLGRLAVSGVHQGRKLGRLLLMDALFRSWKSTTAVASVGVVAEALNDAARAFYLSHAFIPLVDQPRKLFLAMRTIQKAFA